MRIFHKISIHQYIHEVIHDRKISAIIEEWNIEYEEIAAILINHFESMGIYEIFPLQHEEIVLSSIYHQLKYNPEITSKVARMRRYLEEQSAKFSRKTGAE